MNAPRFDTVEALLENARSRLDRLDVPGLQAALADGARVVDIRPLWQREQDVEIPGAVVIERNHLEWRLHPASSARLDAAEPGQQWVVVCMEGYTSSLAADALRSIGVDATDLVGGVRAWADAGLPTVPGGTRPDHVVAEQPRA